MSGTARVRRVRVRVRVENRPMYKGRRGVQYHGIVQYNGVRCRPHRRNGVTSTRRASAKAHSHQHLCAHGSSTDTSRPHYRSRRERHWVCRSYLCSRYGISRRSRPLSLLPLERAPAALGHPMPLSSLAALQPLTSGAPPFPRSSISSVRPALQVAGSGAG